jgi:uncharacterized protein
MDRYETVSGMFRFFNMTFMRVGMWLFLFGMPMVFFAAKLGLIIESPPPYFKPITLSLGAFLFGSSMAIGGYCPGVGLASLGRGALDVLVWGGGMVVGNIIFAEVIYGSTFHKLIEYVSLSNPTWSKMFGFGYATSWFELPFILGFTLMFLLMIILIGLFDAMNKYFDKTLAWFFFRNKSRSNREGKSKKGSITT